MKTSSEHNLKAERRDVKKKPKMKVHGQALKRPNSHAGLASIKAKKK